MIHFMVPSLAGQENLRNTNLASTRLRIAIAAEAIEIQGHKFFFGERINAEICKVVVVGKIGANEIETRAPLWISEIRRCRSRGAKIILDYTDNHIGNRSKMEIFYLEALVLSDRIIVPSEKMVESLPEKFRCNCKVIPDGIEYPCSRAKEGYRRNAIWFGHGTNVSYLLESFGRYRLTEDFESITVCTDSRYRDFVLSAAMVSRIPKVHFIEWSVTNLRDALRDAGFAYLPVGINDPKKSGAGPNRLLTALSFGLPVFTQNLCSYSEFREYYFDLDASDYQLTVDLLSDGRKRARRAQQKIIPNFSFMQLGNKWCNVIMDML